MRDFQKIDLRSDTVTRPSPAMLEAMMRAKTGDEQRGDDPTVNRLCAQMAERLGKEAAMFLPSGTMANQIAFMLHCRPGDEVIAPEGAHVTYSEGCGVSALAGAQLRLLPHDGGAIAPSDISVAIRPKRAQSARSRLLLVEQTCNRAGGTVIPLAALRGMAAAARGHGLSLHMDGARLFNAEVASGTPAADFAAEVDTVFVDLTKGLGCPFGAVLAGDRSMLEEAWRLKMRLGGGMRQAGIMAAAGLYALAQNVDRLAEDHRNAQILAANIRLGTGLDMVRPQSNIVLLDLRGSAWCGETLRVRLAEAGVLANALGPKSLRFVTHLDVDADEIAHAAQIVVDCVAEKAEEV